MPAMSSSDHLTTSSISDSADHMNQHCFCRTVDERRLREQLSDDLSQSRPHLFSSTVVFVSSAVVQQITEVVAAIERVVALPGYQAQALARAPAIARHDLGPRGACMGLDFHVGADGTPRLIEVNTNAGCAMLNAVLARAQMLAQQGRVRVLLLRDYLPLAVLKLFVHPLVVLLVGTGAMALGVPLGHDALTVLVLLAALPSASNPSSTPDPKNQPSDCCCTARSRP